MPIRKSFRVKSEVDKLHERLINASERITTRMVLEARKNRNWNVFDKLSEEDKLRVRISELNAVIIKSRK